jgi:chromosome segregation ATPase
MKSEVDEKDAAIKDSVTAETSAREAEDVRLNNAITAETQARENTDDVLQNNINSLEEEIRTKVVEVKAKNASISVDNANATKPEIKVNISTEEDQIVKLNADGIYAKSKLSYDEEHNILIYTNTTGTTTIALKTKSEIDRIYYDKPNERIVIEYTVNGTRKEDVYVPVHDLIEEWRTEDGNVGAIALSKDISVPEVDVLKARLILNTTHGDNAAIIDDNALYVSKNAIVAEVNSEIEELKTRVARLEEALQLATQEHTAQSQKITQVEQKNASQDNQITEIKTKNRNQDESIADLLNYINVNTNP